MRDTERASAPFHSYDEAVQWMIGLTPMQIKPGLKRVEALLNKLGNPQRRLKFIHVAGTNGKGSTCAFLTGVLMQCGYTVGTFTSPYIEKFTNRIQCNGKDIEERELLELANKIKPLVDEVAQTELASPAMFDVVTALAIEYYANVAYPDYVVWETGLGGRLDSTNIVYPVVSVITNIGHDHMEILGDTLEKVALEKAGIIKSGVPVISAAKQPETIAVIERAARDKQSTLYLLGRQYHVESAASGENAQTFDFVGPFRRYGNVSISLSGAHQLDNAAVAIMTLEVLRQYTAVIIDEENLIAGMKATHWPGRLEMISEKPRILIDGAHNPEGAESLALALKQVYRYRRLRFMFGMLSYKNHSGYLRHILPIVDTLVITEPDFRKKMPADELYQVVNQLLPQGADRPVEIIVEPDWKKALDLLQSLTQEDDLAVVSGTLYMISDVRSWILYQSNCEKGW